MARSALVIFLTALLLSLLAHLEIFGVLGTVAEWAREEAARNRARAPGNVEIEFSAPPEDPSDVQNVDVVASNDPVQQEPNVQERPPEQQRREREPERVAQQQPPQPPPPQPPPPQPPEPEHQAEPTPTPPPPQHAERRQSITQHSDETNTEPPPEARFLAEQNRHVEEETVASIRNYQRDDEHPVASATTSAPNETQEGNDTEQDVADMREREGSDARAATPREAAQERPREASTNVARNADARGNNTQRGNESDARAQSARTEGARASASASQPQTLTINDGNGTFVIPLPRNGGQGQAAQANNGQGGRGQGLFGLGNAGSSRQATQAGGRGFLAQGSDVRVSWSAFEDIYTPQQLQDEREAYFRERRSKARGTSRRENWQAFRAAIENFVPNVRPGTQTALNAAASPFAAYLSEVHRRIHREFVDRFIANMSGGSSNEMNDPGLVTKLEIIVNRDGTLHRLGIVATSGYSPYDYGAFEAVVRAQPFPEAPSSILSGDGRVYMHWALNRDERHCGTWNAEPYILPHPANVPAMQFGPQRDLPRGVMPRDSQPASEQGALDPAHIHQEDAAEDPRARHAQLAR